jgi:hypothetical protein
MKYIKLFEAFKSSKLPNFRVNLIKPGMGPGNYLFTCLDGSWNSFWGVFDLEGLKRLEDAMNTECVFAELYDAINYGKSHKENSAFEEHTIIVVSKINPEVRYINLHDRSLVDPFDSESPNYTNDPPGLAIGEHGLQDENIIHMFSVTTSKSPLKESPGGEKIENYPIVINELNYADHHWSDRKKTKDYVKAFDDTVGFRTTSLDGDYGVKEIKPYMESIIDSGIPQGVLKTIEEIESAESAEVAPVRKRDPREEEFERSSGFLEMIKEIQEQKDAIVIDIRKTFVGRSGRAKYEEYVARISPFIRNAENVLKEWESNLPEDYVSRCKEKLSSYLKSGEIMYLSGIQESMKATPSEIETRKFDWARRCPKEMVRELTRPVKNLMDELPMYYWGELGPMIDRIDYLIKSNNSGGLQWKNLLRDSSSIQDSPRFSGSQPAGDRAVEYFKMIFYNVLNAGVFKDAQLRDNFWKNDVARGF